MSKQAAGKSNHAIKRPPTGLAVFALVGPAFVWCGEYIGTGEVILATRTGAILGTGVIWAVVAGIFLKYWIGMSGARYTVCTGEGMIDMFDRIPGPRHWVVWIVLVAQFIAATISLGSVAAAGGVFVSELIPLPPYLAAWLVTIFCLSVVWSGLFNLLKMVMSLFVLVIVVGVITVAVRVFPGPAAFLEGLLFHVPPVPEWAVTGYGVTENPWREILPLLGWAAGGFASQVWYTYWVLGAGYGAAAGRSCGQPADLQFLRSLPRAVAERIKGWCRVVYTDATVAMVIGVVVTVSFLVAGAGVLGPSRTAPEGPEVATTLSTLFSSQWGALGGLMFMLAGAAALIGTQIGLMAGWPRLLADAFRICIPGFQRAFTWKTQFHMFLIFFLCTNMIIAYNLGLRPVFLVKMSAVLEGLLLTPFQAVWIAIGLYVVMPRLMSEEARDVLRPHWIFAVGLLAAFGVFGYFCVFQIPLTLW
ncbi:MAG: Nramp family divalent metal transporter [Fidelibacterota bacterium]|nr:MAG: Nramp family divalent metal transporter [Candidatus Neomarinimicrobiota bacterium]